MDSAYANRYYSPEAGRFITKDPTGHKDSINLYEYSGSRPADNGDALGLGNCVWTGNTIGPGTGKVDTKTHLPHGQAVNPPGSLMPTPGRHFSKKPYPNVSLWRTCEYYCECKEWKRRCIGGPVVSEVYRVLYKTWVSPTVKNPNMPLPCPAWGSKAIAGKDGKSVCAGICSACKR